ncbi:type VII secretion target [Amycolatopsis sp. CA-230715]|uniref:type VII secretion target n=1 Tax=Amycolatopsis sp. CA-230715 TaxID=2745196 RepID=UPI001C34083E|nr:type VII secretion target [Amycolatopsis sp. CA-230715]QWF80820.1 hypothetical protein HUW46_04244 [Amycolatopsis sp. CA-230715]
MPGDQGAPGNPLGTAVPRVPGMKDIDVDPDQVLEVAKIVEDQANALQARLTVHLDALHIDPPAQDVVSGAAVSAWNQLVADGDASYAKRVREYVQNLRDLAGQLRDASHKYVASDEEKAESLRDRRVRPN